MVLARHFFEKGCKFVAPLKGALGIQAEYKGARRSSYEAAVQMASQERGDHSRESKPAARRDGTGKERRRATARAPPE